MGSSGQHILIVDDVLKNLQLTAQILKDAGYIFSLSQSGEAALSLVENEIPDLILLDVMMPGMSGFDVCRKLKGNEKLRDIPVIFLTALNQTNDLVEGFRAGGVDFIYKPFNREELLIRVKTHLELSASKKKLIEMNRTRDKLYSIIAHDIRSPLSSINITINAIKEGIIDVECDSFMKIIKDLDVTTHATIVLLNNLLEWTKQQAETVSLVVQHVNMRGVVAECMQLLNANAKIKGIILTTEIDDDCEAFVDEVTIHTVIRNLISNAIKFTPEGGSIIVNGKCTTDCVVISVTDTGVGIPEEVLHRIFDENEQYSTPGTNNERGSGLGFYMVKDFVKKNGGKISVKSELDVGTEVTIELPLG